MVGGRGKKRGNSNPVYMPYLKTSKRISYLELQTGVIRVASGSLNIYIQRDSLVPSLRIVTQKPGSGEYFMKLPVGSDAGRHRVSPGLCCLSVNTLKSISHEWAPTVCWLVTATCFIHVINSFTTTLQKRTHVPLLDTGDWWDTEFFWAVPGIESKAGAE